jgi:hypothetical protein
VVPRESVRARLVLAGAQGDFLAHQLHPVQVERDRLAGDVVPGNLRSVFPLQVSVHMSTAHVN